MVRTISIKDNKKETKNRRNRGNCKKYITYFLIIIIVFGLCGCGEKASKEVDSFHEMNNRLLYNEQEFNQNALELINDKDYQVYLSGEAHTMQKSYTIRKELLQYLHENCGVCYYVDEGGFGAGLLLERYLQTGDQKIIRYFMKQIKGTLNYNQEQYEFWTWLYEYNQKFDEKDRIHVVGLDVDHQYNMAIMGINTLIDESKKPGKHIKKAIKLIKENNQFADVSLIQAFRDYPEEVKEYFGDNFSWIENAINNFKLTNKYYSQDEEAPDSRDYDIRDQAMMDNFNFIYSIVPNAKFFGQFGSEHIYQRACDTEYCSSNYNRFGMRLNNVSSPVRNKVCSILYVYTGKDGNAPSDTYFSYPVVDTFKNLDRILDLNYKGSPYCKKELLLNGHGTGGNTCDYFQKLIILNNSKNCTEYREP